MVLPYPTGWFALATSREVPVGALVSRRLAGAAYVVFRDAAGAPAVLDAYCPHLGAHMGLGGTVRDGTVVCPFHGFRFDGQGTCVATAYGSRPPNGARVRTLPTIERGGWILAWYHPLGDAPTWTPPEIDAEGWSPLQDHCVELATHPQETTENSVDVGHFGAVHGYQDLELGPCDVDGPALHTSYSFTRPRGVPGWGSRFPVRIQVHVWGLGFSYVDVELPTIGLLSRQFVLPTAVEPGKVELRLGMELKRTATCAAPMGWLPKWVFDPIVAPTAMRQYVADVMQDRVIWENKRHIPRPMLAAGDGPVGRYRHWCRQFYGPDTLPAEV